MITYITKEVRRTIIEEVEKINKSKSIIIKYVFSRDAASVAIWLCSEIRNESITKKIILDMINLLHTNTFNADGEKVHFSRSTYFIDSPTIVFNTKTAKRLYKTEVEFKHINTVME